jgi:hypothetical protein
MMINAARLSHVRDTGGNVGARMNVVGAIFPFAYALLSITPDASPERCRA